MSIEFKDAEADAVENPRGHYIHEPHFNLEVAGYSAFDYFGDGSFYLLDVPGVSDKPKFLSHISGVEPEIVTYKSTANFI